MSELVTFIQRKLSCPLWKCGIRLSTSTVARFPRDKDLCEAWLVASQRLDFVPTKYSYLCSEHFTEDQFNRTQKGLRLRPNAVPTVFQVMPKTKNSTSRQVLSKKVPEAHSAVKIAPKQLFEVSPTVKIAPKPTFEVHPTVKIAPKPIFEVQPTVNIAPQPQQVFEAQTPITVVPQPVASDVVSLTPSPLITNLSSIADTVISSNLIQAALSAYKQSTNSAMSAQQPDGTPVSVYVVHPQPNGSNIVTIPSISNFPPAVVGTVPTPNGGSLPTSGSQSAQNADPLPEALANIEKIKRYEERIQKYRREIKLLKQQHQRQMNKIEKLQNTIKDLRRPDLEENEEEEEEDTSEEDMSEDEIYAELLKHQSESEGIADDWKHQSESEERADNCEASV